MNDEWISGHGNGAGEYGEIDIFDRPKGNRICTLESFHRAHVTVQSGRTTLVFAYLGEPPVTLITDGYVEFSEPAPREAEV